MIPWSVDGMRLGGRGYMAATKRHWADEGRTMPRLSEMQRSGMERADKLGIIPYKRSVIGLL